MIHGTRLVRTFEQAAAYYVEKFATKASLETEIYLLKGVLPYIGHLPLPQVHDDTLAPFVQARLEQGRAHKTINLGLGVVRLILNLAATSWRDDDGNTWLTSAPAITMLPLKGHQRPPRPITWGEQRKLLPALPGHLARMSLFILNTAVRDDVVCNLQWEWEIKIPELGISVFVVPPEHVKGGECERVVVCNTVAQDIVESQRGKHPVYVFVYRRESVKLGRKPKMAYHPITRMSNSAWETGRAAAGLGDLHVHDLRHTAGLRLREAGVDKVTRRDVFWHAGADITDHYSMAQIRELHDALELIKADSGKWNKSLATLRLEQRERDASYQISTTQKKTA